MEDKQYSALSILKNIFVAALTLWLVLGVPTGWLYDLRVGAGTDARTVRSNSTYPE